MLEASPSCFCRLPSFQPSLTQSNSIQLCCTSLHKSLAPRGKGTPELIFADYPERDRKRKRDYGWLREAGALVGVFFVAAAARKDPKRAPDKFKEFVGVFEVQATGEILSDWSIETKIVRKFARRTKWSPMGPELKARERHKHKLPPINGPGFFR